MPELPELLDDVRAQAEALQKELDKAGKAVGLIAQSGQAVQQSADRLADLSGSVESLSNELQGIAPQDIVKRLGGIESEMATLKMNLDQTKLIVVVGVGLLAILQFVV